MYDINGIEFIAGRRIKNIDPRDSDKRSANFGEKGVISRVADGKVFVDYDNGDTGNASKPEKYYQILNDGRISKEYQSNTSTPCETRANVGTNRMNNPISSVLKAVKRMAMSASEKALVDSGLKDECGIYTETAIALMAQTACQTDVALGNDSVLIASANAVLADRKAKKDADK